jgi:DNA-directed RNA polymerase subunit RPC12/RpoP
MARKYTIEEIRNMANEINKDITLLSEEYINSKTKLKWKCKICDNEWETNWNIIQGGSGCPVCTHKRLKEEKVRTFDDVKDEVEKLNPNIELLEYNGCVNKMLLYCKIHNIEFKTHLSNIRISGCGCRLCSNEKMRNNYMKPFDELISSIYEINKNIKINSCSEEYFGLKTRLKCECLLDGYKWETIGSVLLKGHGCPMCAGNAFTTYSDFIQLILENNIDVTILSKEEEYINSNSRMKVKCNICDYEYNTTLSKIKVGYRCEECATKLRSGIYHYKYNPNLTDEHRDRKRMRIDGMNQEKWRNEIFKRDNYTCILSGQYGGKLNAHHLNGYNWDTENQFNIDNGVTVSYYVHNLFHKLYGKKDNTKEQFQEFSIRYNMSEFDKI